MATAGSTGTAVWCNSRRAVSQSGYLVMYNLGNLPHDCNHYRTGIAGVNARAFYGSCCTRN